MSNLKNNHQNNFDDSVRFLLWNEKKKLGELEIIIIIILSTFEVDELAQQ